MLVAMLAIAVVVFCAALEGFLEKVQATKQPPIGLLVRPQVMAGKSTITAEIHVPANARNRGLTLRWDSVNGYGGSTERQVDGEDGPVLFRVVLPDQAADRYVFTATLFGANNTRLADARAYIITPDGGQR